MSDLCTIVQFYPADNDMKKVFILLGKLFEQGCGFEIGECECGHYDWYIDKNLTGPLTAKQIEERIQLAGLVYELVVVGEDEIHD